MKLLFAVVQNEDSKKLIRALNEESFAVTKIASSGGFLQGGNTTIMMGIDDERVDAALDIIKRESKVRKRYTVAPQATMIGYTMTSPTPVQITVGGAVVFICDIWRHEHY